MDIFLHGKRFFNFFKSGCKDKTFPAINQRGDRFSSHYFSVVPKRQEWMAKIRHPLGIWSQNSKKQSLLALEAVV
jgi:hypothetical protein